MERDLPSSIGVLQDTLYNQGSYKSYIQKHQRIFFGGKQVSRIFPKQVKANLQRIIKHVRFKLSRMDARQKVEKCLLAISCDYRITILLIILLAAFFRMLRVLPALVERLRVRPLAAGALPRLNRPRHPLLALLGDFLRFFLKQFQSTFTH